MMRVQLLEKRSLFAAVGFDPNFGTNGVAALRAGIGDTRETTPLGIIAGGSDTRHAVRPATLGGISFQTLIDRSTRA